MTAASLQELEGRAAKLLATAGSLRPGQDLIFLQKSGQG